MLPAFRESKLRQLIKQHVEAQIDLSWMGSKMPDEHPAITQRAQAAEERLNGFIETLSDK